MNFTFDMFDIFFEVMLTGIFTGFLIGFICWIIGFGIYEMIHLFRMA